MRSCKVNGFIMHTQTGIKLRLSLPPMNENFPIFKLLLFVLIMYIGGLRRFIQNSKYRIRLHVSFILKLFYFQVTVYKQPAAKLALLNKKLMGVNLVTSGEFPTRFNPTLCIAVGLWTLHVNPFHFLKKAFVSFPLCPLLSIVFTVSLRL